MPSRTLTKGWRGNCYIQVCTYLIQGRLHTTANEWIQGWTCASHYENTPERVDIIPLASKQLLEKEHNTAVARGWDSSQLTREHKVVARGFGTKLSFLPISGLQERRHDLSAQRQHSWLGKYGFPVAGSCWWQKGTTWINLLSQSYNLDTVTDLSEVAKSFQAELAPKPEAFRCMHQYNLYQL